MASINRHTVLGHLGRDPELRTGASGKSSCSFTVATNNKWKDGAGEWKEKTNWIRVVVWGAQAEQCADRLRKGSMVLLEGRVETRSWDKGGQKQFTTETVAENVTFLDKKDDDRPRENGYNKSAGSNKNNSDNGGQGSFGDDDDIPF